MRSERPAPGLVRPGFWLGVVLLLALDLGSKAWAFRAVGLGGHLPLLDDWLSIYCLTNPGGIWGMGGHLTVPLTLVRLVAVGILVAFVARQPRCARGPLAVLALLLAGALGNLYDNLSAWLPWPGNGQVRDFLMVRFATPSWWPDALPWPFDPWPIFNLADAMILLGFLALLTGRVHLRWKREADGEEPAPAPAGGDDAGVDGPEPRRRDAAVAATEPEAVGEEGRA